MFKTILKLVGLSGLLWQLSKLDVPMYLAEQRWQLADLAFHQQDYGRAENLYHHVLSYYTGKGLSQTLRQRKAQVLFRLGVINKLYLYQDNDAARYFEVASRLDERIAPLALQHVANIYLHRLMDVPAAERVASRLSRQFGNSPEALQVSLWLIETYSHQGRFEQARMLAHQVEQTWPPTTPQAWQASAAAAATYFAEKQYDKAIASYEKLLQKPIHPRLVALIEFELGQCYQELGDHTKALAYYHRCMFQHPNLAVVRHKIARIQVRLANAAPAGGILSAKVRRSLAK